MSHPAPTVPVLTDLDRQTLAFEGSRWKYAGAKESAILQRCTVAGRRNERRDLARVARRAARRSRRVRKKSAERPPGTVFTQ